MSAPVNSCSGIEVTLCAKTTAHYAARLCRTNEVGHRIPEFPEFQQRRAIREMYFTSVTLQSAAVADSNRSSYCL